MDKGVVRVGQQRTKLEHMDPRQESKVTVPCSAPVTSRSVQQQNQILVLHLMIGFYTLRRWEATEGTVVRQIAPNAKYLC